MGNKIELGQAHNVGTCVMVQPATVEERLNSLEIKINMLARTFRTGNNRSRTPYHFKDSVNKDGIPVNTSLVGQSTRGGLHVLSVRPDKYYIGTSGYDSLSSAAEASSGVRRSGWTFWKTLNGKTVKEAYGKYNG